MKFTVPSLTLLFLLSAWPTAGDVDAADSRYLMQGKKGGSNTLLLMSAVGGKKGMSMQAVAPTTAPSSAPSDAPSVSTAPSVSQMPTQDECSTDLCDNVNNDLPRFERVIEGNINFEEVVDVCRAICEPEFGFFQVFEMRRDFECLCFESCLSIRATIVRERAIIYPLNGSDCASLVVPPSYQSCNRSGRTCDADRVRVGETEESCAAACRSRGASFFAFNPNINNNCQCYADGECSSIVDDGGWDIFAFDADDCDSLPMPP